MRVGVKEKLDLFEKVAIIKSVIEKWYNTKVIDNVIKLIKKKYGGLPPYEKDKALLLAKWVKENIKYIPEPPHFNDRVKTPVVIMKCRFGDCSEHAILLGCLLKRENIPFVYALVSTLPKEPNVINHIYLEARVDGEKIPLDTTSTTPLGKEPVEFAKVYFK